MCDFAKIRHLLQGFLTSSDSVLWPFSLKMGNPGGTPTPILFSLRLSASELVARIRDRRTRHVTRPIGRPLNKFYRQKRREPPSPFCAMYAGLHQIPREASQRVKHAAEVNMSTRLGHPQWLTDWQLYRLINEPINEMFDQIAHLATAASFSGMNIAVREYRKKSHALGPWCTWNKIFSKNNFSVNIFGMSDLGHNWGWHICSLLLRGQWMAA